MKLSIIVPVYNVENYLARCLDSLLMQDIPQSEYEIIVVNDGSTDKSLAIAEEYRLKHASICLISQKNSGLGAARNTGIKASKGQYMMFVDSDDYLEPDSLKDLLTKFETEKLDALRFNYENKDENYNIIPKKHNALFNVFYDEKIVSGEEFISDYLGWACYVWVFIFRSDLIKRNELYFNEKIYFEDVEWLFRVLLKFTAVSSYDKHIYNYLQRQGSITQSTDKSKQNKLIDDKLFIVQFLLAQKHPQKNSKLNKWIDGMVSLTFMGIIAMVYRLLPGRKTDVMNFIKQHRLKPFKAYHFTVKQLRDLTLMNISTSLYGWLRK